MDDKERRSAFVSALTTEHSVMQAVIGVTINESGSRASIYVFAYRARWWRWVSSPSPLTRSFRLWRPCCRHCSCLAYSPSCGLSISPRRTCRRISALRASAPTTALSMRKQRNILPPIAAVGPSGCENAPSLRAGPLIGYLTTGAIMIASINAMVGAAGVALLLYHLMELAAASAVLAGIAFAAIFLVIFYRYQRSRTPASSAIRHHRTAAAAKWNPMIDRTWRVAALRLT